MKKHIVLFVLLVLGSTGYATAQTAATPTPDALLRASYVADAQPLPRFDTPVGAVCADILMHAHRQCQPYPELPTAGMTASDMQKYTTLRTQLQALRDAPPAWETIVAQRSAPPTAPVMVERSTQTGGYAQRASAAFQGRTSNETSTHGDASPLPANKPAIGVE